MSQFFPAGDEFSAVISMRTLPISLSALFLSVSDEEKWAFYSNQLTVYSSPQREP